MKCLLSIILLLSICVFAQAQTALLLSNASKNKMFEVKEGQTLSIKYRGYLGQVERVKSVVSEITDSTVTIGINPERLGPLFKNNEKLSGSYKVVRITDILAFRRMTIGRQITKSIVVTGVIVGSYFLLYDLYNSQNIGMGEGFLISLGVGIASVMLVDAIFPENPKYNMEDGWVATVIHE